MKFFYSCSNRQKNCQTFSNLFSNCQNTLEKNRKIRKSQNKVRKVRKKLEELSNLFLMGRNKFFDTKETKPKLRKMNNVGFPMKDLNY